MFTRKTRGVTKLCLLILVFTYETHAVFVVIATKTPEHNLTKFKIFFVNLLVYIVSSPPPRLGVLIFQCWTMS